MPKPPIIRRGKKRPGQRLVLGEIVKKVQKEHPNLVEADFTKMVDFNIGMALIERLNLPPKIEKKAKEIELQISKLRGWLYQQQETDGRNVFMFVKKKSMLDMCKVIKMNTQYLMNKRKISLEFGVAFIEHLENQLKELQKEEKQLVGVTPGLLLRMAWVSDVLLEDVVGKENGAVIHRLRRQIKKESKKWGF